MRVAVVGGCGSGKTTIVRELRERGYDAFVVGQEHSAVSNLWSRQSPDALVFLDVPLEVVRRRRGPTWPAWLYEQQVARLSDARSHADLTVDTGTLTIRESVSRIEEALDAKSTQSPRHPGC